MEATPTQNNLATPTSGFLWSRRGVGITPHNGETGANFYDGRGRLYAALCPIPRCANVPEAWRGESSDSGLKTRRSRRAGCGNHPRILSSFSFACQYAGVIPVPLTAAVTLGSHNAYVRQLHGFLTNCDASILIAPPGYEEYLDEASEGVKLEFCGTPEAFAELPEADVELQPLSGKETAYINTHLAAPVFPAWRDDHRGSVLNNLKGIAVDGAEIRPGDRFFSWLPFYHDMGLIGPY